jgi:hypothetical protein
VGRICHEFVCIDPPQVRDEYTRCKHWFREDQLKNGNSAVVVSIFRDPMDWVEAMRSEPHHAHDHLHFRNDSQVELVRQEPTEDDRWWWELADRGKNLSRSPGWDRRGPNNEELAQTRVGNESVVCWTDTVSSTPRHAFRKTRQ